ncbi:MULTISPECIES: SRPBCC domain-containing protein [Arthrobacter]|uniref:SRPBCC domain-containing protein n=1 Tax=Arthrobacter jinronghuae TaxID=2964609 RepID=A0ABT1NMT7_9MICC|nr:MULTISPECIES: SRPBCC domain-containing protein [Arthrobacter]MCQ1949028.1 SRPBCC domain-containing protein [Arthrobacter jinronghuae]MCQ1952354.1 SRPBCC domain-containing protein [Arthrobacter sp. zg-Y238]MCQ1955529.1 SRPBCC domain-containing protein [Arthrobacter jinronghuae]UWX78174.1 SRPBCC domain-containing protein [Arthrobacter jinronghuae]
MSDLDIILEKTVRSYGRRQIQAGHALMIVMERDIPHPIGEVWSALADPEQLRQWVADPEGDLRRGGTYTLPDGSHGTILRCDGPRLLTVSWAREGSSVAEVEFHLTGEDGFTRFELRYASVRKGFAVTAAPGAGLWTGGAGWEYFLDVLEEYLAGTIPDEPQGIRFEIEAEGPLAQLFEARNERWLRTAHDFDQEHIP